jgi:aspartyl/asparaginyl beta-hydroxylase (cupin superfamily)
MNVMDEMRAAIANSADGHRYFFDPDNFSWVRRVEAYWSGIREEADRVLGAIEHLPGFEEIQVEQEILSTDRRWKIFPFCAYGHRIPENERRCPRTFEALQHIPGLRAAMFSVLEPRKELPPHNGPYNGVLRYHLGVRIPRPETQCGIMVGNEMAYWKDGHSLVFDDSHWHYAWNRSNQHRVVLFVDFERPLPEALARRNAEVIVEIGKTEFITEAIAKWKQWDRVHGPKLDAYLGQPDALNRPAGAGA